MTSLGFDAEQDAFGVYYWRKRPRRMEVRARVSSAWMD